ncbi:MAG: peptidylprolyl isomerase, partial [Acidimicrobiales bacterium]
MKSPKGELVDGPLTDQGELVHGPLTDQGELVDGPLTDRGELVHGPLTDQGELVHGPLRGRCKRRHHRRRHRAHRAHRAGTAAAFGVCLALLATVTSACNANLTPYAAKVGGATVSTGTLKAAMSNISSDSGYRCLLGGGHEIPVKGAAEGTYSTVFASGVLTNLVRSEIIQQEAARHKLPLPSSARAIAAAQLQQSLTSELSSSPSCQGTASGMWAHLGATYRNDLVNYQLAEDALAAEAAGTSLRPSDLARYATSHRSLTTQDCLSVIEVRSRAVAAKLRTAIAGGASFAATAKAHSIDPSSAAAGGSIGCVLGSQLVAPLPAVVAALTPGTVSQPVKYQASWLLLLVTSRQTESAA